MVVVVQVSVVVMTVVAGVTGAVRVVDILGVVGVGGVVDGGVVGACVVLVVVSVAHIIVAQREVWHTRYDIGDGNR